MATSPTTPPGSFRVPNSIIQGLTTGSAAGLNTPAGLNRPTAVPTGTPPGLLTQVPPRSPDREVRTNVSTILEIIEVSRQVAHAVEREWSTGAGEVRRRRYTSRRYSPKHLRMVHEALLVLHNHSVLIQG